MNGDGAAGVLEVRDRFLISGLLDDSTSGTGTWPALILGIQIDRRTLGPSPQLFPTTPASLLREFDAKGIVLTYRIPEGMTRPFVPRTALGRRLWELRQRIIDSGERLLDWEEIDREIASRRGERE
jgi:hypothetical protein